MLKRTMLRVLPTTFWSVLKQMRLQGLFLWLATLQFNSFSSNVAKQVARFTVQAHMNLYSLACVADV